MNIIPPPRVQCAFVPQGQNGNSPAFQRRDRIQKRPCPEGTIERPARFTFQPSLRDATQFPSEPSVETLGYYRQSLRDYTWKLYKIAQRHTAVILVIVLSLFSLSIFAQGSVRFRAVDIYLDSKGKPLAAYQLEFAVTNSNAKIVGIEGGEHPAFAEPPFYDPKAMQHEKVILAAFSTEAAEKLPSGKTRVASVHLQINGTNEPEFELKLQTAADPSGNKIPAEAGVEERKAK